MKKYLEVLGLTQNAGLTEIKQAYRKLAKQWHPDRFVDDPQNQDLAADKFREITAAYEYILNSTASPDEQPNKRKKGERIQVKKNSPESYYQLALEFIKYDNEMGALEALASAIRCDKNYLKAYQYRGFLLEQMGLFQRAEADFAQVARLKRQVPSSSSTQADDNFFTTRQTTKTPFSPKASNKYSHSSDVSTWKATFISNSDAVTAITINCLGTEMLAGYGNGVIYRWNCYQKKYIDSFTGHHGGTNALVFTANNLRFYSGGEDNFIREHNLSTGESRLLGASRFQHARSVNTLALSIDGNRLFSGSSDNTLKIWNLQYPDFEPITIKGSNAEILTIAYNSKGDYLAIAGMENCVRLRWPTNGKLITSLKTPCGVTSLAISADGKQLAIGGFNHQIMIWDLNTGGISQTLSGHKEPITNLHFLESDAKNTQSGLISVDGNGEIRFWNITSGQSNVIGHHNKIHETFLTTSAFNTTTQTLVTGGRDNRIGIWKNLANK